MFLGGLLIFSAAGFDVYFKKKSLIYWCVTRKTNQIELISISDNFCVNKAPQMNQSALCIVEDKIDLV